MILTLGQDDDGRRLDRILRKYLSDVPLSSLHRLLRTGKIRLNGKKALASDRVHAGEQLSLQEFRSESVKAEPIAEQELDSRRPLGLDIIVETKDLLVLSKPRGMVIHGEDSLDELVQEYLKPKLSRSLSFRSGPLHRLDTQTSGLVAFSCSLHGAQLFSLALKERRIRKQYLGIFEGAIAAEEFWEDELHREKNNRTTAICVRDGEVGKKALTHYRPLAATDNLSLGLVEIGTGRTHQIRAQAASRKHPLLGDTKYQGRRYSGGYFLHAYELNTREAKELGLSENVLAPLPDIFLDRIKLFFGKEIASILGSTLSTDALLDAIL